MWLLLFSSFHDRSNGALQQTISFRAVDEKNCAVCAAYIINYFSDLARVTLRSKGATMANVKKGNVTPPPQWWKHLREWKRVFWKRERRSQDKEIQRQQK
jgi:hypothetical protein